MMVAGLLIITSVMLTARPQAGTSGASTSDSKATDVTRSGCQTCHAAGGDLAEIGSKYEAGTLDQCHLRPVPPYLAVSAEAGDKASGKVLEKPRHKDARDLQAYLEKLK